MKFGCCIQRMEDIGPVADLGYDFYEFAGSALAKLNEAEFQDMLAANEKAGIPCIGFNSYCAGRPSIVGEGFCEEEILAYARLLCGRGDRLHIRNVGIGAPAARRLPVGFSLAEADSQCEIFLRFTAEEAKRHGQTVLFEAVHRGLCDYAVYTEDAVRMTERLHLDNLAMVLDFYHMKMMKESLSAVEGALPYLRHVHVSTREDGLRRGYPRLGDAEEYKEIFLWLKEKGYDGTLSIEASTFAQESAGEALVLLRKLDREIPSR